MENTKSLLQTQRELNALLENQPTLETLTLALLDELGEVLHLVKPNWAWWKRYGKEFPEPNYNQLAEELTDCLHFALTMALMTELPETLVQSALTISVNDPINTLLNSIIHTDSFFLIAAISTYAQTLGVPLEKLIDTYYKKAKENQKRFTETRS